MRWTMEIVRELYFPYAVSNKNATALVCLDYYGCATEAKAEHLIRQHLLSVYGRVDVVFKTASNEFYIGSRLVGRVTKQ